tara:strand:+ start:15343 stop:16320 length:978 start_codon:yes stop_codon:yes gene_type:complete
MPRSNLSYVVMSLLCVSFTSYSFAARIELIPQAQEIASDIFWLCKDMKTPSWPRPDRGIDTTLEQFEWSQKSLSAHVVKLRAIYPDERYLKYIIRGKPLNQWIEVCDRKVDAYRLAKLPKPQRYAQQQMLSALEVCRRGQNLIRNQHTQVQMKSLYKKYKKLMQQASKLDPLVNLWKKYDIEQCEKEFVEPYQSLKVQPASHKPSPHFKPHSSMLGEGTTQFGHGLVAVLKQYDIGKITLSDLSTHLYTLKESEFFMLTAILEDYVIYSIADEYGVFFHLAMKKKSKQKYRQGQYLLHKHAYKAHGTIEYRYKRILAFHTYKQPS